MSGCIRLNISSRGEDDRPVPGKPQQVLPAAACRHAPAVQLATLSSAETLLGAPQMVLLAVRGDKSRINSGSPIQVRRFRWSLPTTAFSAASSRRSVSGNVKEPVWHTSLLTVVKAATHVRSEAPCGTFNADLCPDVRLSDCSRAAQLTERKSFDDTMSP